VCCRTSKKSFFINFGNASKGRGCSPAVPGKIGPRSGQHPSQRSFLPIRLLGRTWFTGRSEMHRGGNGWSFAESERQRSRISEKDYQLAVLLAGGNVLTLNLGKVSETVFIYFKRKLAEKKAKWTRGILQLLYFFFYLCIVYIKLCETSLCNCFLFMTLSTQRIADWQSSFLLFYLLKHIPKDSLLFLLSLACETKEDILLEWWIKPTEPSCTGRVFVSSLVVYVCACECTSRYAQKYAV